MISKFVKKGGKIKEIWDDKYLTERNGLLYRRQRSKPYTGEVREYFVERQASAYKYSPNKIHYLRKIYTVIDGKKEGYAETYFRNGSVRKQEKFTNNEIRLNINEIRVPELVAKLVGESIAEQLERRVAFRRAVNTAMQRTMQVGAKGIKVVISGRLAGADIARTEKYHQGRVPLHTVRADIDLSLIHI